ncbi:hypothetical protein HU762_17565 [Pseudomonas sp. SWRI92]|uniref:Uncharacterized protein n=1 Tax=Pseudomonas marvdashtae TaxID=2745500 RepID=A0A923JNY3_9PSED|nr:MULTISPECIES: hypothetical protein [Pseudomonas]MBC3375761.1 hypothetical protein [Pseudomonas sp. SWRI92]MBV4552315.1 hypothetical protein [Pseudomonas marvdashtae]
METKHTPGPWYVQDDHGRRYIETEGNDDTIAEIHRRRSKGSVYSCAEAGANASLIAAAPELLEALQAARDLWGDYLPPGNSNAMKAMKLVDAAITKATA